MASERRRQILERLLDGPGAVDSMKVCSVVTEMTGTDGAGILLIAEDTPQGSVCSTNAVSAYVEDLQYALGEGPGIDAHATGRAVSEPDLDNPVEVRWVGLTGPAVDAGVRAIFAFPLAIGGVRLGAIDLFSTVPGPLTDDQHANALSLADIATSTILLAQAEAEPGQLADELLHGNLYYAVHQASGMIAAQLEVSVGQAIVRLRAHAFGNDRPLHEVAEDVVARRLRFNLD